MLLVTYQLVTYNELIFSDTSSKSFKITVPNCILCPIGAHFCPNATLSPYQPGDRVQVVGTYRCLPSKRQGYTAGTFRTILIACNVIVLSKEVAPLFSAKDVAKIKRFSWSSRHDPFELLAQSLAPSIHGHHFIKRAVLCMRLGGVEKILENGTHLRG